MIYGRTCLTITVILSNGIAHLRMNTSHLPTFKRSRVNTVLLVQSMKNIKTFLPFKFTPASVTSTGAKLELLLFHPDKY